MVTRMGHVGRGDDGVAVPVAVVVASDCRPWRRDGGEKEEACAQAVLTWRVCAAARIAHPPGLKEKKSEDRAHPKCAHRAPFDPALRLAWTRGGACERGRARALAALQRLRAPQADAWL
eukprot:2250422-Rhodomonas_salina.2